MFQCIESSLSHRLRGGGAVLPGDAGAIHSCFWCVPASLDGCTRADFNPSKSPQRGCSSSRVTGDLLDVAELLKEGHKLAAKPRCCS